MENETTSLRGKRSFDCCFVYNDELVKLEFVEEEGLQGE